MNPNPVFEKTAAICGKWPRVARRIGAVSVVAVFGALAFSPWANIYAQHVHVNEQTDASSTQTLKRSLVHVSIPAVRLVRDDGSEVNFNRELQDPRPVFLNFIFTSCTSVCPVMSQIFSALQEKLGSERERVKIISVSIDPEYDTPSRLTAYARQFGADQHWRFYGGLGEASTAVQKAFGVLTRDKMSHTVASFYRAAPGQQWVRIEGFASPAQLESEYRATSPIRAQDQHGGMVGEAGAAGTSVVPARRHFHAR